MNTVVAKGQLTLQQLADENRGPWDAYVRQAAGGLPLQLSGWQDVLRDTYGYQTQFLLAREGDMVRGVMPLFVVPSRLTGRRAMTMPGGLCAENGAIAAALVDASLRRLADAGVGRLRLQDSRQPWTENWSSSSHHVYWRIDLQQSEEALWKQLDGNIRRQVRIARRNKLRAQIDRRGALLEPFYEVFSQFTHQAGTPVFGRSFLQNVVRTFPEGFNIAVIWREEQPIAGYFQLQMAQGVYGMWGAALAEALQLRPAYLALWEIIRDAADHGYAFLDMGRSPAGSNASQFKGQWGGVSSPVFQIAIDRQGRSLPDQATDQIKADERFHLFMKVWPRLPLSVTRRLGPKLRWHVPFA